MISTDNVPEKFHVFRDGLAAGDWIMGIPVLNNGLITEDFLDECAIRGFLRTGGSLET